MRLTQVCRILDYSKERVLLLARSQVLKNRTVGGHRVFQPESVLMQRFLDLRAAGKVQPLPYSPDSPYAVYLWLSGEKPIRRQLAKVRREVKELAGSKRPIFEFVDSRGCDADGEDYPWLPELFEAAAEGNVGTIYVKDDGRCVDRKFLESVFGRGFCIRIEYLDD